MAITCPLCRCDLPQWLPRRVLDAARCPDDGQILELVSVQEQLEADEAERRPAHLRRLQRERRFDGYAVFTISGRPYEDLPIAGPQVRPARAPQSGTLRSSTMSGHNEPAFRKHGFRFEGFRVRA